MTPPTQPATLKPEDQLLPQLVPAPVKLTPKPAAKTPRRWGRRVRGGVTIAVALVVLVAAVRWVSYRATNVVAPFAFAQGGVVLVGTPRDGQITEVLVRVGQRVNKDDELVRFNDLRQRAQLAEARALLTRARLEVEAEERALGVERKRVDVNEAKVTENVAISEAEAQAAGAKAAHASTVADRADALSAREMIPLAEREAAASERDVSQAMVASAASKARYARAEARRIDVERAAVAARAAKLPLLDAAVEMQLAAVAAAEAEVELTVIRAPGDGVVSRRILEPGAAVKIGYPILEMWLDTDRRVEAWIEEDALRWLRLGEKATVVFPSLGTAPVEGKIDALGVVSDAEFKTSSIYVPVAKMLDRARWVRVDIALEGPLGHVPPGLTAEVAIARPFVPWLKSLVGR